MRLYDVVELVEDLPGEGLTAGMVGTVVDAYTAPSAYEVEFADERGTTIAVVALRPEQIKGSGAEIDQNRR